MPVDLRVRVAQVHLAAPDALDLGPAQGDPRLELLEDVVVVPGPPVDDDDLDPLRRLAGAWDGHTVLRLTPLERVDSIPLRPLNSQGFAEVAELVDALGSGSSEGSLVGVQIPPSAP